jgi:hypothetical protein
MDEIKKRKKPPAEEGLIGLFGHTYIADPDDADERMIQYQFRVFRKLDAERYLIQYFSFLDGSPTQLGVMPKSELLGETVRLYAKVELWLEAYKEDSERLEQRRRAKRASS